MRERASPSSNSTRTRVGLLRSTSTAYPALGTAATTVTSSGRYRTVTVPPCAVMVRVTELTVVGGAAVGGGAVGGAAVGGAAVGGDGVPVGGGVPVPPVIGGPAVRPVVGAAVGAAVVTAPVVDMDGVAGGAAPVVVVAGPDAPGTSTVTAWTSTTVVARVAARMVPTPPWTSTVAATVVAHHSNTPATRPRTRAVCPLDGWPRCNGALSLGEVPGPRPCTAYHARP